jgi:hypothetical protein
MHDVTLQEAERMKWRIVLSLGFACCFLLVGFFYPHAILLNLPFALLYFIADRAGWWQPGILWVTENRVLSLVCFFGCPMVVSLVLGFFVASVTRRLLRRDGWRAHMSAAVFVAAVFGLILALRVDPDSYFLSFYGYWTSNY